MCESLSKAMLEPIVQHYTNMDGFHTLGNEINILGCMQAIAFDKKLTSIFFQDRLHFYTCTFEMHMYFVGVLNGN